MKLSELTYRKRLVGTAIGIAALLIAIGVITRFNLYETFQNFSLVDRVKDLEKHMLKMRKIEKDFLIHETANLEFYESGRSELVEQFRNEYEQTLELLNNLRSEELVEILDLKDDLMQVKDDMKNYNKSFLSLVHHVRVKGFKDYGIIGKMREQIHAVENQVKINNDLLATKYMLTLRRHEKDYLLRHDVKYKTKFETTIGEFYTHIDNSSKYNRYNADLLATELKEYKNLFNQVIDEDKKIGLLGESGVIAELSEYTVQIENEITDLHERVYKQSEHRVKASVATLFIIIGILSTLILAILYRISHNILHAIEKLKKHILLLGQGNLPEEINYQGSNEITEMMESLNTLTVNLKNTREFAIEVGDGKLESDVNVFNNEGDLGGSLVEMRTRLLKVAKEREEQESNDRIRMWVNDGLAQFADIISTYSKDMDGLTYRVVKQLIKYLQAEQGALFVRDDLDTALHDPVEVGVRYIAKSVFAYGRKKYSEAEFSPGEGIVGTCVLEEETTVITEIPDDYVEITSGLGKSKPKAILIVPLKADDQVLGVIEIASFKEFEDYQVKFVETVSSNLASNLLTVSSNVKTKFLLEQSQMQANEMAAQEEELRQNMEELTATQEAMAEKESLLKDEIQELKVARKTETLKLKQELQLQKLESETSNQLLNVINKNVLVGELEADGKFITVNHKFTEVLGYEIDEIRLMNIRHFISKEESKDFEQVWHRVENGEISDRLSKRESKTGKKLWLKTSYAPLFDKFGELEKVFFVAKDVTCYNEMLNSEGQETTININETKKYLEDNLKFFSEINNNENGKHKNGNLEPAVSN